MKNLTKALSVGASRFGQSPISPWSGGVNEPSTTGIRAWLLNGVGYSNVVNGQNEIIVECNDTSWAEANASDLIANREAAFESLLPRQHHEYSNRAVAWPVITCYYSAYFAAQAFLRCLGLGSVYLEKLEADTITNAWIARGFSASVDAQNYSIRVELTNPVTVRIRKLGGKGGAHQQFWSGFQTLQNAIYTTLLSSPAINVLSTQERQSACTEYTKLVDLCFSNCTSIPSTPDFGWLSRVRNGINYRFANHLWLMNWQHSAGLISNHQSIIDRYSNGDRKLPEPRRNFGHTHLVYVATRFCKLVREATSFISVN